MNEANAIKDVATIERIKANLREAGEIRELLLFVVGLEMGLKSEKLLSLKVADLFDQDRLSKVSDGKSLSQEFYDLLQEYSNRYPGVMADMENFVFFAKKKFPQGSSHIGRNQTWKLIQVWCDNVGLKGAFGLVSLWKTYNYFHGIGLPNAFSDATGTPITLNKKHSECKIKSVSVLVADGLEPSIVNQISDPRDALMVYLSESLGFGYENISTLKVSDFFVPNGRNVKRIITVNDQTTGEPVKMFFSAKAPYLHTILESYKGTYPELMSNMGNFMFFIKKEPIGTHPIKRLAFGKIIRQHKGELVGRNVMGLSPTTATRQAVAIAKRMGLKQNIMAEDISVKAISSDTYKNKIDANDSVPPVSGYDNIEKEQKILNGFDIIEIVSKEQALEIMNRVLARLSTWDREGKKLNAKGGVLYNACKKILGDEFITPNKRKKKGVLGKVFSGIVSFFSKK